MLIDGDGDTTAAQTLRVSIDPNTMPVADNEVITQDVHRSADHPVRARCSTGDTDADRP